jgi:hypothetical protein
MVSEEPISNGRVSIMDKMKSMLSEDLNCTPDKYYKAFKKQKTNLPRRWRKAQLYRRIPPVLVTSLVRY